MCHDKSPSRFNDVEHLTAYFVATASFTSVRNRDLYGSKRTSKVFSLFMDLIMENMVTTI